MQLKAAGSLATSLVLAACSAQPPAAAPVTQDRASLSGPIGNGPPPASDPRPFDEIMNSALGAHVEATGLDPRLAPEPSGLPDANSFVRRSYEGAAAVASTANLPAHAGQTR